MELYRGVADILDADGTLIGRADARLEAWTARNRPTWGGTLEPLEPVAIGIGTAPWLRAFQQSRPITVRLPNGHEGHAIILAPPASAEDASMSISGTGPAPQPD